MKPPKKWARGAPIYTYGAFETAVRAGRMMFVDGYFRERATSGRVVANMSYWLVTRLIMRGDVYLAVQSEGYREWLRDELLGVPADRGLMLPRWESSLYDSVTDDYEIVEDGEAIFS